MLCAIEFQYAPIFKEFIDTRTQRRGEATLAGNKSEAALHKLIDNAAYGYTLLNKEKYVRIVYADVKNLRPPSPQGYLPEVKDADLVEVDHGNNKVQHDIPTQLGYSKLQGVNCACCSFTLTALINTCQVGPPAGGSAH